MEVPKIVSQVSVNSIFIVFDSCCLCEIHCANSLRKMLITISRTAEAPEKRVPLQRQGPCGCSYLWPAKHSRAVFHSGHLGLSSQDIMRMVGWGALPFIFFFLSVKNFHVFNSPLTLSFNRWSRLYKYVIHPDKDILTGKTVSKL